MQALSLNNQDSAAPEETTPPQRQSNEVIIPNTSGRAPSSSVFFVVGLLAGFILCGASMMTWLRLAPAATYTQSQSDSQEMAKKTAPEPTLEPNAGTAWSDPTLTGLSFTYDSQIWTAPQKNVDGWQLTDSTGGTFDIKFDVLPSEGDCCSTLIEQTDLTQVGTSNLYRVRDVQAISEPNLYKAAAAGTRNVYTYGQATWNGSMGPLQALIPLTAAQRQTLSNQCEAAKQSNEGHSITALTDCSALLNPSTGGLLTIFWRPFAFERVMPLPTPAESFNPDMLTQRSALVTYTGSHPDWADMLVLQLNLKP